MKRRAQLRFLVGAAALAGVLGQSPGSRSELPALLAEGPEWRLDDPPVEMLGCGTGLVVLGEAGTLTRLPLGAAGPAATSPEHGYAAIGCRDQRPHGLRGDTIDIYPRDAAAPFQPSRSIALGGRDAAEPVLAMLLATLGGDPTLVLVTGQDVSSYNLAQAGEDDLSLAPEWRLGLPELGPGEQTSRAALVMAGGRIVLGTTSAGVVGRAGSSRLLFLTTDGRVTGVQALDGTLAVLLSLEPGREKGRPPGATHRADARVFVALSTSQESGRAFLLEDADLTGTRGELSASLETYHPLVAATPLEHMLATADGAGWVTLYATADVSDMLLRWQLPGPPRTLVAVDWNLDRFDDLVIGAADGRIAVYPTNWRAITDGLQRRERDGLGLLSQGRTAEACKLLRPVQTLAHRLAVELRSPGWTGPAVVHETTWLPRPGCCFLAGLLAAGLALGARWLYRWRGRGRQRLDEHHFTELWQLARSSREALIVMRGILSDLHTDIGQGPVEDRRLRSLAEAHGELAARVNDAVALLSRLHPCRYRPDRLRRLLKGLRRRMEFLVDARTAEPALLEPLRALLHELATELAVVTAALEKGPRYGVHEILEHVVTGLLEEHGRELDEHGLSIDWRSRHPDEPQWLATQQVTRVQRLLGDILRGALEAASQAADPRPVTVQLLPGPGHRLYVRLEVPGSGRPRAPRRHDLAWLRRTGGEYQARQDADGTLMVVEFLASGGTGRP